MKFRDYSLLLIFIFNCLSSYTQNTFLGRVLDNSTGDFIEDVQIQDYNGNLLTLTDKEGKFKINYGEDYKKLIFYKIGYKYALIEAEKTHKPINIFLEKLSVNLCDVIIVDDEFFNTKKLEDVEGDAILAGKKSNKIMLKNSFGNISTNNARHVFNKV